MKQKALDKAQGKWNVAGHHGVRKHAPGQKGQRYCLEWSGAERNRRLGRAIRGLMTAPRRILPGMTYSITRRCLDRRFYLKPTPELQRHIKYVLGQACRRYGVKLHAVCIMFNHIHLIVTDMRGVLPLFMQDVFRLISRVVKVERPDIEGPVFDNRRPCVTALLTPGSVAQQLAYVVTNPVTANLVVKHGDYPGLVTHADALRGMRERVARPKDQLLGRPKHATFEITPWRPLEVSEPSRKKRAKQRAHVLELAIRLVAEREAASARERRRTGDFAAGPRRLMARHHLDRPEGRPRRSDVVPALAASDPRVLKQGKRTLREWRRAYRDARAALSAKLKAVLPAGSWWLPRQNLAEAACLAAGACPIAYYLGFD